MRPGQSYLSKKPLKYTEYTLKELNGKIRVTAHMGFLTVGHDILYFEINDS